MKTIYSNDHENIVAESFDVLIDPRPRNGQPPVIGLMVDPYEGKSFILPMPYHTAKEVAETIFRVLLQAAPELFVREWLPTPSLYPIPCACPSLQSAGTPVVLSFAVERASSRCPRRSWIVWSHSSATYRQRRGCNGSKSCALTMP
jgi:hypothetical protein